MKTKILAITALTCCSAFAATINVSNRAATPGASRVAYDASGTALGSGWAAIGIFSTLSDPDFALSTGADLSADFTILGSANTNLTFTGFGPDFGIPGIFEFGAGQATPAGSIFVGRTAFLVVGNGSDLASSSEALIIRTNTVIPEDPSTPITLDFASATTPGTVVFGSGSAAGDVLVGQNVAGSITNGYQLGVLIPEPSVALLGAFGVLGLLRRRR